MATSDELFAGMGRTCIPWLYLRTDSISRNFAPSSWYLTIIDGGVVTPYAYAQDSNRLTSVGLQAYSYDAAGNTLSDGERSYTYDARNRMTAADLYEYGYNALGQRVFKPRLVAENPFEPDDPEPEPDPPCDPREESCEDPLPPPDPPPPDLMSFSAGPSGVLIQVGWLMFQYDDAGRLIGEYDELGNAVRQYVWLDDLPIAMLNADGIHYLHADHLNTPRTATDGTGQVAWSANLRPFGDEVAPGGALEMPLRFPGQYFDQETGLHQNWFREYAPGLGRYTQSDPIGLAGGDNLYAYVAGNPARTSDQLGLGPVLFVVCTGLNEWYSAYSFTRSVRQLELHEQIRDQLSRVDDAIRNCDRNDEERIRALYSIRRELVRDIPSHVLANVSVGDVSLFAGAKFLMVQAGCTLLLWAGPI